MAAGDLDQMVVYEEQFYLGAFEVLEREVNAFNAASNNCIRLVLDAHRGQFEQESFFKLPTSFITHRDPTVTTAVTPTSLVQDELVRPKINKKIHVQNTIDSFRKIGRDPAEMAFILGQQSATSIAAQYIESAMSALIGTFKVAAVQTALTVDSTTDDLDTTDLVDALAKRGDKSSDVALWVMHSKVYYDLVKNQINQKIDGVSDFNIFSGMPVTLNRPVLVIDSPALFNAGSSTASSADDVYYTFGLAPGAVTVKESEDRFLFVDTVTGIENTSLLWIAEFAYDIGVAGMKFSTGTTNPTDANLATNTNWTQAATDTKSLPGVAVRSR